ncbi:tyrosine-type recombinase/integrase [Microbacterium foliorum]|nr:tyrosine-type recombinase/integrase [Microbacterium foliorum]
MPFSGSRLWLVVHSEDFEPVVEARDFAMYLLGRGRSENTIRSYMPKVAAFLNWADQKAVDWRTITLPQMAKFKTSLEGPRLTKAGEDEGAPTKAMPPRKPRTVNLTLTAVHEFLRFCVKSGWVERSVTERLVEPTYLTNTPAGFDAGEHGQYRYKFVSELRAKVSTKAPKTLTRDQVTAAVDATTTARDRFLLLLLDGTGMRIGEALGLRRSDLHFLPDSTALGCEVAGAHVEIARRSDNANRAWAKSRMDRAVPVLGNVVAAYRDYCIERDEIVHDDDSDYVFVSLSVANAGTPLTYSAVMRLFASLRQRTGYPALRPHLFRHTAATRMRREGVDIAVLQALLGHSSPQSTAIYAHVLDDELRAAAELGRSHLDRYRHFDHYSPDND